MKIYIVEKESYSIEDYFLGGNGINCECYISKIQAYIRAKELETYKVLELEINETNDYVLINESSEELVEKYSTLLVNCLFRNYLLITFENKLYFNKEKFIFNKNNKIHLRGLGPKTEKDLRQFLFDHGLEEL